MDRDLESLEEEFRDMRDWYTTLERRGFDDVNHQEMLLRIVIDLKQRTLRARGRDGCDDELREFQDAMVELEQEIAEMDAAAEQ